MVGHRPAMMSQLDKLAILKDGALEAFGPADTILSRLRAVAQATRPGRTRTAEPAEGVA
jgi:ABC-type protease/lipase transport system fused ATPase/permease subunit